MHNKDSKLIFEAYDDARLTEYNQKPEEKKEIEIGKKILHYTKQINVRSPADRAALSKIEEAANELIKMHGSPIPADWSKMNPEEKSYVQHGGGQ